MNGETLADGLAESWRRWPDRVAVSSGDRHLTYAELGREAAALAAGYRNMGLQPGDRVLCQLPNGPECIVAMAAAWTGGFVHVGASPDLTTPELTWMAERAEVSALVLAPGAVDDDLSARARAVLERWPTATVVAAGEKPAVPDGPTLDALVKASDHRPHHDVPHPGTDDVAAIFFTSGTTGRPKGPLGFHGPLAYVWRWFGDALRCGPDDVHLGHLPLAFGFGMMMATVALLTGGRLVLVPRFSVTETLDLVERERISVLNGTPSHYTLLLDRLEQLPRDVSSLRTGVGSAAAFGPGLLRRVLDELRMELLLLYGSSELLYVCTSDRDDLLAGSVGRPEPGQVVILGADGEPLPPGHLGQVAFRVRWPLRYWKEPDAGRDPGEWFATGDVGRMDEAGRLYVLGRITHQINRGGHKVDPGEVEAALHGHTALVDHAVVGVPDPVLGERVCICVVPRGEPPALGELRTLLAPSLAAYKLPEELRVLDHIPRNRNGKVDYPALRAEVLAAAPGERTGEG